MPKKYRIVQVNLQNEDADLALTTMVRDGEWEFVCCVPIQDNILCYTFCREVVVRDHMRSGGIRPAPAPSEEPIPISVVEAPTPAAPATPAPVKSAAHPAGNPRQYDPSTTHDGLEPATYRGNPLMTYKGEPLYVQPGEEVVFIRKPYAVCVSGNEYNLNTGRKKIPYKQ